MRPVTLMIIWVLAGCAGAPTAPPPPGAAAVASQAGAASPSSTPESESDAKRRLDAKKEGFTLVNKSGEVLYCRTELRTGSHVAKDTTCLTQKQLDEQLEQTRQELGSLKTNVPRPGK